MASRRRLVWGALALALLVLLLFFGPLGTLVLAAFESGPLRDALAFAGRRKLLVVAVGGLAFAALAAWLWISGRRRVLGGVAIALAAVVLVYATQAFRTAYPRANLFDPERLADMGSILLGADIPLSEFEPAPMLKVERKAVPQAAFPVIDVHFHLGSLPPSMTPERLIRAMDAAGVRQLVNLDGSARDFERFKAYRDAYPDRIILFVKPDFGAIRKPGGIEAEARRIEAAARDGARGLKVAKSLGLTTRDASGRLVPLDDPRLAPIWDTAARLGLPVLMHSADPPAFFLPTNRRNERYEELVDFPDWSRAGPGNPTFKDLMAQRERLLARHPQTIFIGAHVGSNEEDLAYVASLMDRYPNYYVDISARVAGLGRQPATARRFLIQYQDRVLFGSDGGYAMTPQGEWTPEHFYRAYFEFLETENEYMQYPMWGAVNQGRWRVQGVNLPREVLEKLYWRNAERLLPPARASAPPTRAAAVSPAASP